MLKFTSIRRYLALDFGLNSSNNWLTITTRNLDNVVAYGVEETVCSTFVRIIRLTQGLLLIKQHLDNSCCGFSLNLNHSPNINFGTEGVINNH